MPKQTYPDVWSFEKGAREKGFRQIAGIDEAGRGPLAGPVVSAAVILPEGFDCPGLTDSKKLSEKKRDALYPKIRELAVAVGVGMADHEEIDRINVLQAALLSMKRAMDDLATTPDYLLIDGKFTIDSDLPQEAIVKGDSRSISVAAASIIAKVTRDRIMKELAQEYPVYGFDRHKGYPTKAHKQAIIDHGPCPVHRRSFRGVRQE
ncbi:MAG TPA: ribonuclease HII [Desulfobacteraceae bacterium]|nr:ribonuclease HII [Desulfobacteraceae bacterium]